MSSKETVYIDGGVEPWLAVKSKPVTIPPPLSSQIVTQDIEVASSLQIGEKFSFSLLFADDVTHVHDSKAAV